MSFTEKSLVVPAELITPDEALQVQQEARAALPVLLSAASDSLQTIAASGANGADRRTLHAMEEAAYRMSDLRESIESGSIIYRRARRLESALNSALPLLSMLSSDVGLRGIVAAADTMALRAYAKCLLMADAEAIVDDADKALLLSAGWAFDAERERLAREFSIRFPRFFGYRVETPTTFIGFDVNLTNGPPEEQPADESPLDALVAELEAFLKWELRKIGLSVQVELVKIDTKQRKTLRCAIEPIESDSSLAAVCRLREQTVGQCEIDSTVLLNVMKERLVARVDDWLNDGFTTAKLHQPTGEITTTRRGPWLWIKARAEYGGVVRDPSADRLSGDHETNEDRRDWVGPAETVPGTPANPTELDEWAMFKAARETHNLRQEGRVVEDLAEDGRVTVHVYKWRYPQAEVTIEHVELSNP